MDMNEKLAILKMLENKQITADEAARLLQAVDSPGAPAAPVAPSAPPPVPPPSPAPMPSAYDGRGNNGPGPRSGSIPPPPPPPGSGQHASGHSTIEDLGRKFESFARDMAPKVQKFAESAVSAIVGATDKVSDAFSGSPDRYSHAPPPRPSTGGQTHRASSPAPAATAGGLTVVNIEKLVSGEGCNELSLSGLNGEVRIKGYNGDKISARLSYKAKRTGASIELVQLGAKYFLNYEPDDFTQVSIDAYVPERAFGVLKIDSINCEVDCSSLSASDIRVMNANGSLSLSGIAAGTLMAENSNGRLAISNIVADTATLENGSGQIECTEPDIANMKITSYNSPISLIVSGFNRHTDYLWSLETANAKLGMNLPTLPSLGYYIKAHAAMGEIRLGLTGMQFLINEPSLVEARSVSFDAAAKRVKIVAETSNAQLAIS